MLTAPWVLYGVGLDEASSWNQKVNDTSGMAGPLNGPWYQGASSTTATDTVKPGTNDEGRADGEADGDDFTRLLCIGRGSNALKLATLWESVA
ncbi:hypothetical protein NDU88_003827 [Pleurodeles waltl]|uniref:Uncharacterized protein n=1 Tax=Pleurodeles waltl TaxID=8319 RepID=A0AAV7UDY1_PLEWA|nr:hypothetical protein NDU88_003827 [Pleurodeles waltl]